MLDLWSLPGPARFAGAVRARLERGQPVTVGLPGSLLAEEGFCQELAGAIDYAADVAEIRAADDRPVASVLADRFCAYDVPAGREAPSVLARHPALQDRTVAIAVPESDAAAAARTAEFARAFTAASRGVPVADRPRLLVLCRRACAADLIASDPFVTGVWWWGVLERLDTALHLRRAGADCTDELLRDCVTEVAAFDLRLAEHLLTAWDGAEATLAAALKCGPGMPAATAATAISLPHSSTALGAPPVDLADLWDRGLVDRWDAFPAYLHPTVAGGPAGLRSRVWRAQIRTLMPVIEEERARIEEWLRQEVPGLPAATLEPGDLYATFQDYPRLKAWRGGHRKRLVYWLRDARNALAHLGTLPPADVARGRELIHADRRNT